MCYVGFSIQIYPTEEQKNKIKEYFGASRFVYNLGIEYRTVLGNLSLASFSKN